MQYNFVNMKMKQVPIQWKGTARRFATKFI